MNLDDARNLATTLMMEHGLQAQGWTFKFDNAKRRFGECRHGHKTLSLSQSLVILNDEARVGATMLHEIAHALVGPRHGHDAVWKRKAIELGDDGERYYDTATVKPSAPLRVVCPGGHSLARLPRLVAETLVPQVLRRSLQRGFRAALRAYAMKRLLLVALSVTACTPTAPTDEPALAFIFIGATAQQQEAALALWNEQRECTGLHMVEPRTVTVTVMPGGFLCPVGGLAIMAAGCTSSVGTITVGTPWFENAISHEFIHWALILQGRGGDPKHETPIWERCDQRNRR